MARKEEGPSEEGDAGGGRFKLVASGMSVMAPPTGRVLGSKGTPLIGQANSLAS